MLLKQKSWKLPLTHSELQANKPFRKRRWVSWARVTRWQSLVPLLSQVWEGKYSLNMHELEKKSREILWQLTETPCYLSLGVSSTIFATAVNENEFLKDQIARLATQIRFISPRESTSGVLGVGVCHSRVRDAAGLHTGQWHAAAVTSSCTLKFYIGKGKLSFCEEKRRQHVTKEMQTICPCGDSAFVPFHLAVSLNLN